MEIETENINQTNNKYYHNRKKLALLSKIGFRVGTALKE